jgi:hypothetical protein
MSAHSDPTVNTPRVGDHKSPSNELTFNTIIFGFIDAPIYTWGVLQLLGLPPYSRHKI